MEDEPTRAELRALLDRAEMGDEEAVFAFRRLKPGGLARLYDDFLGTLCNTLAYRVNSRVQSLPMGHALLEGIEKRTADLAGENPSATALLLARVAAITHAVWLSLETLSAGTVYTTDQRQALMHQECVAVAQRRHLRAVRELVTLQAAERRTTGKPQLKVVAS